MRSLVVLLASFALFFSCTSTPPEDAPEEIVVEPGPDGLQVVDMVAGSYWFRPDRISVRAGAPVELRIDRDTALVPHNFSLHAPDAGIDVDVDLGGGLNVVRFTPSKAGEYAFYCDLGSHEEKGMHGTLVVREK